MPTAVDNLSKDSSDEQIQKAISQCIESEVNAGRDQDQAIAMCHEMARDKTGGRPAKPRTK